MMDWRVDLAAQRLLGNPGHDGQRMVEVHRRPGGAMAGRASTPCW